MTAGPVFHRTRIPLLIWFWAIFFLARHKKGISTLQLQRDTGAGSYETAWTMLHKLRSTLGPRPEARLKGLVEADESYVGGSERGLRGGRWLVGKTLVAGAVERRPHGAGRVRLAVLEGLTFEQHLGPFVRGVIDPSQATVRTVGFQGYRRLSKVGVRHERFVQGTDPARSAEILPRVHRIFGNLKTWFRGTFHGVSGKHLPRYLAGFVYRFDRRWREGEIFGFVLQRAAQGEPFYGAPAPAADVGRIEAPLLLHLAEQDERINALWPAYRDALEAHGKPYQAYVQPGTRHGFHNDTTPRYDAADARLAWEGTVTFFRTHLVGGG